MGFLHYCLFSGISYFATSLPRATASEETSYGSNQYVGEKSDTAIAVEDVPSAEKNGYNETLLKDTPKEESPADDQEQTSEFLDNLNKLDSEGAYSIILSGSAAFAGVWLASALVGAIDSIPLFPKLMEVVGLGYTFWFSTRYLLFKKNRDELAAKIEELKQQVLGSDD